MCGTEIAYALSGDTQVSRKEGAAHVKLYLAPRYGWWRTLADNQDCSGSFVWKVPTDAPQGVYCVRAKSKPGSTEVSPCLYITVRDEMSIVQPPEQGAEWTIGELAYVEWRCDGAPRDDVSVSLGSRFFALQTLAEAQPESGSLYWKVPTTMKPGWYYLTVTAASSRVYAYSGWIHVISPPEPAQTVPSTEESGRVGGLGPLEHVLAPSPGLPSAPPPQSLPPSDPPSAPPSSSLYPSAAAAPSEEPSAPPL